MATRLHLAVHHHDHDAAVVLPSPPRAARHLRVLPGRHLPCRDFIIIRVGSDLGRVVVVYARSWFHHHGWARTVSLCMYQSADSRAHHTDQTYQTTHPPPWHAPTHPQTPHWHTRTHPSEVLPVELVAAREDDRLGRHVDPDGEGLGGEEALQEALLSVSQSMSVTRRLSGRGVRVGRRVGIRLIDVQGVHVEDVWWVD